MHTKGVSHCDISLENAVLSKCTRLDSTTLRIIDFGHSRAILSPTTEESNPVLSCMPQRKSASRDQDELHTHSESYHYLYRRFSYFPIYKIVGKPSMRAPEIVFGLPTNGQAIDAWAVAMVSFSLLSGKFLIDEVSRLVQVSTGSFSGNTINVVY